jgi:M6 family metalloprotease-like protein
MKLIHKLLYVSIIFLIFCPTLLHSAFLRDMPVKVTQPNGEILNCLASGDEFHNWLHDAKGFTIIQSPKTGYYVYAEKEGERLVAGNLIAGISNPQDSNLVPNLNISQAKYRSLRESKFTMPETRDAPTTGTINNIVIFIRFSDETEFNKQISTYEGWFNSDTNSQKNYFLEASYNQLTVNTSFYPAASNGYLVSWQDSHPRSYYKPYNSVSNPNGYFGDYERQDREFTLLENAIAGVQSSIPQSLVIDGDNDGRVDNVVFTVKGDSDGWSDLLWPHRWAIYDRYVYLNGKRVYDFNFQLEEFLDYSNVGVICHEFFHTLGAPDLYHYYEEVFSPTGNWDLMEATTNPPQHMGAYMKYKYGGWISSIPTISADGLYTLNPLTSSTNNCFKINSPNSTSEYFVVEYRKQMGTYESSLPGSGLLIYRINPAYDGNADGPPDEVYIYRPNGTTTVNGSIYSANYSANVGRTAINSTTNPTPFLTDGSAGGLVLSDIGSAGATISFVKGEGLANITWTPHEINQTMLVNSSTNQNITIGNTGNATLNYTVAKPSSSFNVLEEGFESGDLPTAWSVENISGQDVDWQFTSGGYSSHPESAQQGTYNARFYHGSSTASVSKLITPAMNLTGANTATLTFYHTQAIWANDQDELRLYYRTSSATSWNLLATYTDNITDWTNRSIELPNLTASYQIAFEATGQYGYGVCLDAINVSQEVAGDYSWLQVEGGNTYSDVINPGTNAQSVSITLDSNGLIPGDYEADISIASNASNSPQVTIPVSMNVTGIIEQNILVDSQEIDFGTVNTDEFVMETITITNIGGETLTGNLSANNNFTITESRSNISKNEIQLAHQSSRRLRNYTFSLSSGASKSYDISHTTEQAGTYLGSLTITSNDPDSPQIEVDLSLEVKDPANISVNPQSIAVNLQADQTTDRTISLANTGDLDLTCSLALQQTEAREVTEIFSANFDDHDLSDWNIDYFYSADHTWHIADNYDGTSIDDSSFLFIDSDAAGTGVQFDDSIETPTFNVSSYEDITIEFIHFFNHYQEEIADVDFWNGSEWINIGRWQGDDIGYWSTPSHFSYTITNEGYSNVKLRFRYYDAEYDWFWAIDNLVISGQGNPAPQWVTLPSQYNNLTITPDNIEDVTLNFSSAELATGLYTANLSIQSNSAENNNLNIPISLNVYQLVNEPDWQPVIYPNNSATIYAEITHLNDQIAEDDIISAWIGDECRGLGEIVIVNRSQAFTTLVVQSNGNPENVYFKLYDRSADIVITQSNATSVISGQVVGSAQNPFPINIGLIELITPNNIEVQVVNNVASLNWPSVPNADYYEIYYSQDLENWALITSVTTSSYQHSLPPVNNHAYFYKIIAKKN